MFNVILSFLPDVSSSYIDYCLSKGYVPGREKRPYGMCKVQPFCSAAFEGTFKEVSVFRRDLERQFDALHFKVKRSRLVSPSKDGVAVQAAPGLYLEAVLTVPIAPLAVDPSALLNIIAFMRGRNGGVYQDVMCARDDRKETWRAVIRSNAHQDKTDERSEQIVKDAYRFLPVTDMRIQQVHIDSHPDMDGGWIK